MFKEPNFRASCAQTASGFLFASCVNTFFHFNFFKVKVERLGQLHELLYAKIYGEANQTNCNDASLC